MLQKERIVVVPQNSDYFLSDTIQDTSTLSQGALFEDINKYDLMSKWFETLSDNEKMILRLRFGLDDKDPQTLDSVGKILGVTRERIRQIEAKALVKLRQFMDATELTCTV